MGRSMATLEAEVASILAIIGHAAGLLPSIATIFAILWYLANLYDWWNARRLKTIGTVAYDHAVANLPSATPAPVAVILGSIAAAHAVNEAVANLPSATPAPVAVILGSNAYAQAVANLPSAIPAPVAVILGSLASAHAVNEAVAKTEE